jgi:SAM-dependent methyltransferase
VTGRPGTGARDIDAYAAAYRALPFEPIQAAYRRRRVLAEVARVRPARLLEVGCGELPLFPDLPGVACTVVEPAPPFVQAARALAAGHEGVRIVQGYLEDLDDPAAGYDMIVLSCLLHEVPDPQALLAAVRRRCAPDTVVHVNVPNARSLHRLLAVAMGLIPDVFAPSATQRTMQQRATPYDRNALADELSRAGLDVVEAGSLFVKPFTHLQMQQLVDAGFLTASLLDGLDRLSDAMPDLGSELWMNARRRP